MTRALAAADAAYEPFAPFVAWAAEPVARGSWEDAASHLAASRDAASVEEVNTALDEVLRAAAVDTGAIEGLYRADRGFTLSVARNVISLDQAEVEAGIGFRRTFEAQLAGFQMAVALATGGEVLTEAAIREVHRVTCADDATYRVLTPHGVQERALDLGAYKVEPNHVQRADGSFHSYAPVDRVPDEMHRLVDEMRSDDFAAAPAVVQAAFVHHALTSIHPFSDGNGRVARLLASVWLLRAASIPLWVEVSDREAYVDALAAADGGDRQPFLRFVTSVSLRLLRELAIVVSRPPEPPPPSSDDEAALRLAAAVQDSLGRAFDAHPDSQMLAPLPVLPSVPAPVRVPNEHAGLAFNIGGSMLGPGTRAVVVGIDSSADDMGRFTVLVFDKGLYGQLVARHSLSTDEVLPEITPPARRRIDALVDGLVSGALHDRAGERD